VPSKRIGAIFQHCELPYTLHLIPLHIALIYIFSIALIKFYSHLTNT
jgi:hypothetical protein